MHHQQVPPAKRSFARQLRRDMTEAEERLWRELRSRRLDRIKFRRQAPIGNYVADFVYLDAKLIVELDGSQHADSRHDTVRDAELKRRGFRAAAAEPPRPLIRPRFARPPSPTRDEGEVAAGLALGKTREGEWEATSTQEITSSTLTR